MRIRTHFLSEGRLVEDMENKIRNTLNEIYFGKTKDIVNGLRSVQPLAEANSQVVLQVTWVLCLVWTASLEPSHFRSSCWPNWMKRTRAREVGTNRRHFANSPTFILLTSSLFVRRRTKNNSTTVIWNAGIVALISGGLWFINIGKLNLIPLNKLSLST